MGYDLHILRREDYDDFEKDSNISLQEWLAYVDTDSELELTNGYQVKIPGTQEKTQNVPGFCNWHGHPFKSLDVAPWFDFRRGSISTKYPDDHTIKKMLQIADKLNAKVLGDDGEIYDDTYFHNKKELHVKNTDGRPWWKF